MHIPDGYLSPKTCVVLYAAMVPVWLVASRKAEKAFKVKRLPLLALASAFVFVVMMFNIPLPGGSAGHIIGGALVSIVLGPWAGVMALSLALALQALLFGDGGVTALGANAFNMGFLMCFSGYFIYRLISGDEAGKVKMWVASFLAAYAAVNVAALAAAIELGIQPMIAQGPGGNPLYAPYPLSIAVPAMMVPHLIFFGPVEGLGTALIVSYVFKTNKDIMEDRAGFSTRPLWIALIVMIILTPLGLLAKGTPWGEWGVGEFKTLVGYIPEGMARLGGIWKGLMPDYALSGINPALAYCLSALLGSLGVVAIIYLWGRPWRRR
jgi:cobalt/nickel transport system permease protein